MKKLECKEDVMSETTPNKIYKHKIARNNKNGMLHYVLKGHNYTIMCGLIGGVHIDDNIEIMPPWPPRELILNGNICKKCKAIFEGSVKKAGPKLKTLEVEMFSFAMEVEEKIMLSLKEDGCTVDDIISVTLWQSPGSGKYTVWYKKGSK